VLSLAYFYYYIYDGNDDDNVTMTSRDKKVSNTFVAAGHPLDLKRVADLSSNHVREHSHLPTAIQHRLGSQSQSQTISMRSQFNLN